MRVTIEQSQAAREAFFRLGSWGLAAAELGIDPKTARERAKRLGPVPKSSRARGGPRETCAREGCKRPSVRRRSFCSHCGRQAATLGIDPAALQPLLGGPMVRRRVSTTAPESIARAVAAYRAYGGVKRAAAALGVSDRWIRRRVRRYESEHGAIPRVQKLCASACGRAVRVAGTTCAECRRRAALKGALRTEFPLPPRSERAARMREHYATGATLQDVADREGISRQRARKIMTDPPLAAGREPKNGRPKNPPCAREGCSGPAQTNPRRRGYCSYCWHRAASQGERPENLPAKKTGSRGFVRANKGAKSISNGSGQSANCSTKPLDSGER